MSPWESRQARLRLKSELAGLRVSAALLRLELKYSKDQPRVPAGQHGGGQFAGSGSGGRTGANRKPAFSPPVAAAATRMAAASGLPAAAGLLGAEAATGGAVAMGAAMGMGVLGISRAAGMANQKLTGGGMTPFLHLPLADLVPRAFKNRGGSGEPMSQGRFDDECEEQLSKDLVTCQTQAAMYGRGRQSRKQVQAICERTAFQRYGECRRGGVDAIRTPIYIGHHHFSSRRK